MDERHSFQDLRTPHGALKIVSLSQSATECLERDVAALNGPTAGGFLLNGRQTWLARGSTLQLVHPSSGERLASWTFRCEGSPVITAVCEYRVQHGKNLTVVGLKLSSGRGLVALFDPCLSRVFKAVSLRREVTALEAVAATVEDEEEREMRLGSSVGGFTGIIAVGTAGGYVYLVDLRLDDEQEEFSESRPGELNVLSSLPVDQHEDQAAQHRRGLVAVELGGTAHSRGYFAFCVDKTSAPVKQFYEGSFSVSTLKYVAQCNFLAVGFTFGGFQLWDIASLCLLGGSNLDLSSPVTHFAFLEPENDPLFYVYLWVARGPTNTQQPQPASITMHQIMFAKRTPAPSGQCLYEGFSGFSCRFIHYLTASPAHSRNSDQSVGSRVISCSAVGENRPGGPLYSEDTSTSARIGDMTLMTVVWEHSLSSGASSVFMGIFDINRWYHAQMPPNIVRGLRSIGTTSVCSFFSFLSLETVMEAASPDALVDVRIDLPTVSRFLLGPHPLPDNFLWPSALTFTMHCLLDTAVVRCKFLGAQREVLEQLCSRGAPVIADPALLFNMCWRAALLPMAQLEGTIVQDAQAQRCSLFTVALHFNRPSFLTSCIKALSRGELSHTGANLRQIYEWAWHELQALKLQTDKLCVPLFDGSGELSAQLLATANQDSVQLSHLTEIFQTLIEYAPNTTTQEGLNELETCHVAASLISQHLHCTVWLAAHNLLPVVTSAVDSNSFVYPYKVLQKHYMQRRGKAGSEGLSRLLMIDLLVEQVGEKIKGIWGAAAEGDGTYPPPSLYALLNVFFLQMPASLRLNIIFYLLLDIGNHLNSEKRTDLAFKYGHAFNMEQSSMTTLHGLWALDNEDFELAVQLLSCPGHITTILSEQQTHVLTTLLDQREAKLAMIYLQRVPLAASSIEDLQLVLDVAIANGLAEEAFTIQRRYSNDGEQDLLQHLLRGCQEHRLLHRVIQLPFNQAEEVYLVRFLEDSPSPQLTELLVMYYLQRARYVEAIRLNKKLQSSAVWLDSASRERAMIREAIVKRYSDCLPAVQHQLSVEPPPRQTSRLEIPRPVPLSMSVSQRTFQGKPVTQADLISLAMEKVLVARREEVVDATPIKRRNITMAQTPSFSPFIGTPQPAKAHWQDVEPLVFATVPGVEDEPTLSLVEQSFIDTNEPDGQSTIPSVTGLTFGDSAATFHESFSHILSPAVSQRSGVSSASALVQPSLTPLRDPTSRNTLELPAQNTPQSILKIRHVSPHQSSVHLSPPCSPVVEKLSPSAGHPLPLSGLLTGSVHKKVASLATADTSKLRGALRKAGSSVSTPRRIRFAGEDVDTDGSNLSDRMDTDSGHSLQTSAESFLSDWKFEPAQPEPPNYLNENNEEIDKDDDSDDVTSDCKFGSALAEPPTYLGENNEEIEKDDDGSSDDDDDDDDDDDNDDDASFLSAEEGHSPPQSPGQFSPVSTTHLEQRLSSSQAEPTAMLPTALESAQPDSTQCISSLTSKSPSSSLKHSQVTLFPSFADASKESMSASPESPSPPSISQTSAATMRSATVSSSPKPLSGLLQTGTKLASSTAPPFAFRLEATNVKYLPVDTPLGAVRGGAATTRLAGGENANTFPSSKEPIQQEVPGTTTSSASLQPLGNTSLTAAATAAVEQADSHSSGFTFSPPRAKLPQSTPPLVGRTRRTQRVTASDFVFSPPLTRSRSGSRSISSRSAASISSVSEPVHDAPPSQHSVKPPVASLGDDDIRDSKVTASPMRSAHSRRTAEEKRADASTTSLPSDSLPSTPRRSSRRTAVTPTRTTPRSVSHRESLLNSANSSVVSARSTWLTDVPDPSVAESPLTASETTPSTRTTRSRSDSRSRPSRSKVDATPPPATRSARLKAAEASPHIPVSNSPLNLVPDTANESLGRKSLRSSGSRSKPVLNLAEQPARMTLRRRNPDLYKPSSKR